MLRVSVTSSLTAGAYFPALNSERLSLPVALAPQASFLVMGCALQLNAGAVILSHNHPSGVAEPSRADEMVTVRLKEALALVDVRVIDHMIIGGNTATSFAERGLV